MKRLKNNECPAVLLEQPLLSADEDGWQRLWRVVDKPAGDELKERGSLGNNLRISQVARKAREKQ